MANKSTHNLRSKQKLASQGPVFNSLTSTTNTSTSTSATRTSTSTTVRVPITTAKTTLGTLNKRISLNTTRTSALSAVTVQTLQTRFDQLEVSFNQLQTDNLDLRQIVQQLQFELAQLKSSQINISTVLTASESGTSLSQQEINTNIVIRGVDIKADTTESELRAIYGGIKAHLGVPDISELDPVSVKIISSNPGSNSVTSRPFIVQLPSVAAKTKLLQVRRTKKDIFQSDIETSC